VAVGPVGAAQDDVRLTHGARGSLCGMAGGEPTMVETEDGLHRKLH
jgi:hypothetical protein